MYIGNNSRTERPRKTKIGSLQVANVTRDYRTLLSRSEGQRSRSLGAGHIVAASRLQLFKFVIVQNCVFAAAAAYRQRGEMLVNEQLPACSNTGSSRVGAFPY